MSLETFSFDASEYLDTEEGIEEFIKAAFETEDPSSPNASASSREPRT